ncbi:MAG: hypothetical protein KAI40_08730 [Desulfobacterales bacterium]|nr:hypothetical protein [Desulfobacterales bacterium]
MKKINVLIPLVNMLGAVSTYIYFSFIWDSGTVQENIPAYYRTLFFVIGFTVLTFVYVLSSRTTMKALLEIAYGKADIQSLEVDELIIYKVL